MFGQNSKTFTFHNIFHWIYIKVYLRPYCGIITVTSFWSHASAYSVVPEPNRSSCYQSFCFFSLFHICQTRCTIVLLVITFIYTLSYVLLLTSRTQLHNIYYWLHYFYISYTIQPRSLLEGDNFVIMKFHIL